MDDISRLEEQANFADEYGDRIAERELFAVALVCKEFGRIGKKYKIVDESWRWEE